MDGTSASQTTRGARVTGTRFISISDQCVVSNRSLMVSGVGVSSSLSVAYGIGLKANLVFSERGTEMSMVLTTDGCGRGTHQRGFVLRGNFNLGIV